MIQPAQGKPRRNQHSVLVLSEKQEENIRMDIYNYLHSNNGLTVNDICKRNGISNHIYRKYLNEFYENDKINYKIRNGL